MHCENATFIYHEEFSKYMKVKGAMSKDVFDYLFDLEAEKFLLKKEKKYVHELFEKVDPKLLENDEDFNDRLEDNVDNYRSFRLDLNFSANNITKKTAKVWKKIQEENKEIFEKEEARKQ